ncbi:hypothetical protein A4X06_0g8435 [Tilletia controversa]|uniref:Uncharacterized protein n=1 Tax=Tilletia controversa TaxID=13291 RepID=A0A8X7MKV8_9BASI|nr:hypothetical protein A4X06_0g8435 [Tilletia controversa]
MRTCTADVVLYALGNKHSCTCATADRIHWTQAHKNASTTSSGFLWFGAMERTFTAKVHGGAMPTDHSSSRCLGGGTVMRSGHTHGARRATDASEHTSSVHPPVATVRFGARSQITSGPQLANIRVVSSASARRIDLRLSPELTRSWGFADSVLLRRRAPPEAERGAHF